MCANQAFFWHPGKKSERRPTDCVDIEMNLVERHGREGMVKIGWVGDWRLNNVRLGEGIGAI